MEYYLFFIFYFFLILFFLYLYIKICNKYNIWRIYDSINNREVIQSAGILITLLLPLFFLIAFWIQPVLQNTINQMAPRPIVFVFGVILLGAVSLYDDIKSIDFRYRLGIQFLVAFASLSLFFFPITNFFPVKLEQLIIIAIIIFIINTTNFYDGLDGMLNINTLFVCLTVLIVSYYEQQFFISTIIAIALIPIIIILLPFNFPIAKIFMGDTGSVVIGYAMSIILLDLFINKLYWIAAVIYFIPVADVTFTLIKKVYKKINLWERLFDYIFLIPLIKFKQNHTVVTLPFLVCNLINLFIIIVSYKTKISELLIINIVIGIIFLTYCSNARFFVKKK